MYDVTLISVHLNHGFVSWPCYMQPCRELTQFPLLRPCPLGVQLNSDAAQWDLQHNRITNQPLCKDGRGLPMRCISRAGPA